MSTPFAPFLIQCVYAYAHAGKYACVRIHACIIVSSSIFSTLFEIPLNVEACTALEPKLICISLSLPCQCTIRADTQFRNLSAGAHESNECMGQKRTQSNSSQGFWKVTKCSFCFLFVQALLCKVMERSGCLWQVCCVWSLLSFSFQVQTVCC